MPSQRIPIQRIMGDGSNCRLPAVLLNHPEEFPDFFRFAGLTRGERGVATRDLGRLGQESLAKLPDE